MICLWAIVIIVIQQETYWYSYINYDLLTDIVIGIHSYGELRCIHNPCLLIDLFAFLVIGIKRLSWNNCIK